MKLPDNSIGVTDILAYRDCARRFAFGMRRHTQAGEAPEATSPSNAYGTAFHDAVGLIGEHGASDDEAIQAVISSKVGRWLAPEDLERLHADLATYRERDYLDVDTVLTEQELRVPLMKFNGEQFYYRFRVDRLYRSLTDPNVWIHIDYKTSRHPKSVQEIHDDPQLSAYAFGLREVYPEIGSLVQVYDQLNFGAIMTSRSDDQIELIKEWLIKNAIAIIEDEHLRPTYNTFCGYCPVLMDCPVIGELTDYALGEIAGLAPSLDGLGPNTERLNAAELAPYVERLEKVSRAKSILEAFDGRLRGTLRELPVDRRLALGFETTTPRVSSWSPDALKAIAGMLGPQFWSLINLPKNAVDRLAPEKRDAIKGMAEEHRGAPRLKRVKSDDGVA